ncbi:hypothetical protein KZY67_08200 [Prevotella melaninogenica]|uniref:hypothetical protein n=1 Tax=Prevotella melaninogenica TaxID=28132 RepID=UPI001C5FB74F|nr:hypothetical protein [Prevotella melaninogenica]MBW4741480.1 hypothetical protein [Prevotella melaninogenica]MBW4912613.1 hypothetical protein [Prevotella melaninogenica]
MLNEIYWPEEYLPRTTDNFVSNEVIVKDLKAEDVWPYFTHATVWEKYYSNSSNARYKDEGKTELYPNAPFFFKTFGFPIDAEVVEFEAPKDGIARIAWHGWAEGDADHRLDVIHAWLLEELPGNRLRILTQESQIGKPAAELAGTNVMIDGHQSWLNGLVKAAQEKLSY